MPLSPRMDHTVSILDRVFLVAGVVFLIGCMAAHAPVSDDLTGMPTPEREFRGVWIATVANIDWPSAPGLPSDVQQAELVALFDRASALNLNTIILQVRPAADALYPSELEPWSEYLTGAMGQAPEPFYDPLAFAVEEAHKRGLELHAWFNPYRARHPTGQSPVAPQHISRRQPEVVKRYGEHLWLDPGAPAAEDHSVAVILDVVRRYDIDGVHLDDYFYPYQEKDAAGRNIPFPDQASWQRAVEAGETRSRDDWRRHNVDRLIERLYREIKREKPWVKFGLSPFGIWRPGHPQQIQGFDAYAKIYADSRKWLHNGWLDYFSPQLYWKIEEPNLSYPVLLDWWDQQNWKGRHLWPGNFTSRICRPDRGDWHPREILEQIRLTRARPGATGNIHFSMVCLMENRRQIADQLAAEVYARPALVPASPWLGRTPPGPPTLALQHDAGPTLTMTPAQGETVWLWIVRARFGDVWTTDIVPGRQTTYTFEAPIASAVPDVVTVSVVDRLGNEGPVGVVRRLGNGN
ncbi:MAG: glycoside hydrolase family 10 protein [Rhodothermales bacterium]